MKTKEDCTGMNTDGIDYNSRASNISIIKKIINEHGEITSTDLELESCPCLYSKGNDETNISELVEEYRIDGVETLCYVGDHSQGYNFYAYEDEELSDEIIEEIKMIMENYEAEQIKLHDSCRDEDF